MLNGIESMTHPIEAAIFDYVQMVDRLMKKTEEIGGNDWQK
jgi:hypothetical protein